MRKLDLETADRIYDILVAECGAKDESDDFGLYFRRDTFISAVAERAVQEYRFGGSLGFGGKFRNNQNAVPYVDCYPEDSNSDRQAMIVRANQAIAALFAA